MLGVQESGKKEEKTDYRDRNDVCPEAPNVPETATERRYPLCPMQKRKTHAHVSGKSCQTRLRESLLYRTCRPLPLVQRWVHRVSIMAARLPDSRPDCFAYST